MINTQINFRLMRLRCFAIIFVPLVSFAQSPVTHSAGLGDNLPSQACKACPGSEWYDAINIMFSDDIVTFTGLNEAGNCFMSTCYYSRFLYAHNFKFAIPADAKIDSILVDIRRAANRDNAVLDSIVQLTKIDSIIGSNLRSPNPWPIGLTYENYGHEDPLWGTTWLPSDINDPASGVVLKIKNLSFSIADAAVDHIQMTVHYTTTTGNYSVTSSPGDIELINSPNELQINVFTSATSNAALKIYNSSGQEVYYKNYGKSLQGQNYFRCPTENLVSGIYFFVLNIGKQSFSRKFIVVD